MPTRSCEMSNASNNCEDTYCTPNKHRYAQNFGYFPAPDKLVCLMSLETLVRGEPAPTCQWFSSDDTNPYHSGHQSIVLAFRFDVREPTHDAGGAADSPVESLNQVCEAHEWQYTVKSIMVW